MTNKDAHSVIKTKMLHIGYSSKKATEVIATDINFSFSESTLIGLVGANGVGKSTLLRTLCGMQSSISGNISIHGKEIKSYSPLALAMQLSVVLTEQPISKNLTVKELVSLGRQPYTGWMGRLQAKDTQAIEQALHLTETQTLQNKHCYQLSDGQLQRVYIARAIAQDTPVIILDEPTTHLDVYHKAKVLQLLKKLTKETNKTILFSTHEVDLAIQLTDQMLVMTKKTTHVGNPCDLITEGCFDSLFPEGAVQFDKKTGRFTII